MPSSSLHDVCILYAYHTSDPQKRPVIESHYSRLTKDNPGVPVVPVVCGYDHWIDGTIDVKDIPSFGVDPFAYPEKPDHKNKTLWMHCDIFLNRYIKHPQCVQAERYIQFDWDTRSNGMSVHEFYAEVWDRDVVGMFIPTPSTVPWWIWWNQWLNKIPPELHRGMIPFSGVLVSRKAAIALTEFDPEKIGSGFSQTNVEFRYAASAIHLGFELVGLKSRETMISTYGGKMEHDLKKRGIYHPITSIK